MTEDERLDEKNADLEARIAAMQKAQEHDDGRPIYPVTADEYTAQLDAKNAALAVKIDAMEKDATDRLAAFPPAPEPKPKAKKAK